MVLSCAAEYTELATKDDVSAVLGYVAQLLADVAAAKTAITTGGDQ